MKKSFMSNLKNFVDSNVRQRIDRVSNNSSQANNNGDPFNDDILLVERHFDDIRLFCVDAEKKISNMLQSVQMSTTAPSNLGTYTHNVQAGLNNLSHNIAQAANITSSASSVSGSGNQAINETRNLSSNKESKSSLGPNSCAQQYHSSESISKFSHNYQRSQSQNSTITQSTHPNFSDPNSLSDEVLQRYKKLPVVGFYKFLNKSCNKLKQDSLLAVTSANYSHIQAQLTNVYLAYEQTIDSQCLKTIQHILETDIPNVLKLRKSCLKAHSDLESLRAKFNVASHKHQQLHQQQQHYQQASSTGHFANTSYLISQNSIQHGNKLEQLKNELDEAVARFEQARDMYETELFGLVCKEPGLVNLMRTFYQLQFEYHQKVCQVIQGSFPTFDDTLALTPRKFAFGTPLEEHLRCTGRTISPVIELCTHFLHLQALKEEGIFRIPGSSIKIKKLKNGINAWFVTLMNLDDLDSDQQQRQTGGHSCIVALHDLFKNAIGQRPQSSHTAQQHDLADVTLKGSPVGDNSNSLNIRIGHASSPIDNHNNQPRQCDSNDQDYILDVHSIAGLLKLYLRELPEPLFTYSLYDNWIACVAQKTYTSVQRLDGLANVVKQLPKPNYENLRHLIKFLNHLTLFQEHNKMTSTNLAIAMAPSLIRSRPHEQQDTLVNGGVSTHDDAQSLNLQMCSFGVSASQHATIIEALINNANHLFPEECDFTLSELPNLTLKYIGPSSKSSVSKQEPGRSVKSTSPTGLSTASSSSFSSNASNSTGSSSTVAANKGHNRKGGSMEGLLGGPNDFKSVIQHNMSVRSTGRPVSVQIRRDDYSTLLGQNASISRTTTTSTTTTTTTAAATAALPRLPPIPNTRSHPRPPAINNSAQPTSHLHSPNKPRAPPVPPPTSIRHQQERLRASGTLANSEQNRIPRPVSLRGTGTIKLASSCQTANSASFTTAAASARPSVPPPERPATSVLISDATRIITINSVAKGKERTCKSIDDSDAKSSHSLTSSGNMRADFEEMSANEVEEIALSTQSNSPVVSLDGSISGDSSFDNENDSTSLDRPWTKCFPATEQEDEEEDNEEKKEQEKSAECRSGTLKLFVRNLENVHIEQSSSDNKSESNSISVDSKQVAELVDGASKSKQNLDPPTKPPRSTSPKIAQSTPL